MLDGYYSKLLAVLDEIKNTQQNKIEAAADMVAQAIQNDGIIYIFGCGHSHLLALDCFYRAGGLVNVSAMLDTDLMLHNGAAKSSKMEKMSGIAESIFERYCLTKKDVIIVISTSGKNAVPVEMAKTARQNSIKTIGLCSSGYFGEKPDSNMLHGNCDVFIDNCVPHGDAVMEITGAETKMGSLSTAAGSFILQGLLLEAAEKAAQTGAKVPIYKSGNIEGGSAFNKALIAEYLPRIKHL